MNLIGLHHNGMFANKDKVMISDLFDMFNRTHDGSSDQDRKDFVTLVYIMLTNIGSSMYTYMLMLEQTGRKDEQYLIKEYRDKIFGIRDSYERGQCKEEDIVKELGNVDEKLSVQVTMLRTIEGRQWEAGLFQTTLNDIPNLMFHLKNIKSMKLPQRVN